MPPTIPYRTFGDIARQTGCKLWQVRRIFERGLMPMPPKLGIYHVVSAADLPQVEQALANAGYLPKPEAAPC